MWFIKRIKENKEYFGFLGFVLPEIFLTTVPINQRYPLLFNG